MALKDYQVRVVANACITRYERGEGTITEVVNSYNMNPTDRELVVAEIMVKRPDLKFDEL